MKTAQAVAVGLIIGFLAGVGAVQMTMGSEVRENTTRISRIEKDMDSERSRTDARIFEVVGVVKEVISSNRELLHVMKMQSELLRQYRPSSE